MGSGVAESAICIRDISDEEHLGRGGEDSSWVAVPSVDLGGIPIGFRCDDVCAVHDEVGGNGVVWKGKKKSERSDEKEISDEKNVVMIAWVNERGGEARGVDEGDRERDGEGKERASHAHRAPSV